LAERYPDTIIWGSDTPANYFIQNFYDGAGNIVRCDLKSAWNREAEILRSLPAEAIQRIGYRNTLRFLLGDE
jgi:hypothetical protein